MAEVKGLYGAIFKGAAFLYHSALAFVATNTITSLDDDFVTSGFTTSQKITVYGSGVNDGDYTTATVSADTMTVSGAGIGDETPTTSVMIYSSAPGTQVTGFYGWSITHNCQALDATDFADVGVATYISGDEGWSATAQAHWMTDEDVESLIGTVLMCRFFVKYSASPSGGAPVYLYEGAAVVTGISPEVKTDAIVERPLTFQGVGPLRYRSLSAYP